MGKSFLLVILVLLGVFTFGCKSVSKYAIDDQPHVKIDTNLIGIWKMQEDTDVHNYFVIERYDDYSYAVTYMNKGGSNRRYENFGMFMSNVGKSQFFNMSYVEWDASGPSYKGYFFLKVQTISEGGWNMELAMVSDPTLREVTTKEELRRRILTKAQDPAFYDKTLHFKKILPLMYCR